MKNILNETPYQELHGRTLFNTLFVADQDVRQKRVLDIGCGYGWFEVNAMKRGVSQVVGIEVSDKDLETARKHLRDDRVLLTIGSAIDVPFADNTFDTAVSWEVIEHIPKGSEEAMFKQVHRVLRNEGVFYLSTPFDSAICRTLDPAWWLIGHRHYSRDKLEDIAERNGFGKETAVIKGQMWEILGTWNLYVAKWVFRRKPFFLDYFNKKQDQEYNKESGYADICFKFRKRT